MDSPMRNRASWLVASRRPGMTDRYLRRLRRSYPLLSSPSTPPDGPVRRARNMADRPPNKPETGGYTQDAVSNHDRRLLAEAGMAGRAQYAVGALEIKRRGTG